MTIPATSPMASSFSAVGRELTAAELDRAGLLHVDRNAVIGRFAVFVPADELSTPRPVVVHSGAVVRSGATVYADVHVGVNALIGHHTLLRTAVQVGADTQLGHHLTVERATRIGRDVRCSPGSHITSSTVLADRVFLGAGVRTINDKTLTWRDPHRQPTLAAPRFGTGAKVGSGSVVLAGVTVGEHALVGAGSLVTHDIPPGALAYGHPARVRGEAR